MSWHDIADYKVGQLIKHNASVVGSLEDLRQDIDFLHTQNLVQYQDTGAGADWTSTSTKLIPIDAAKFQVTITTTGGPVNTWFQGSVRRSTGAAFYGFFTIMREGDPVDNSEPNVPIWANRWKPLTIQKPYPFLPAGTHVFTVYWQISGGSVALELKANAKPFLAVWEGF